MPGHRRLPRNVVRIAPVQRRITAGHAVIVGPTPMGPPVGGPGGVNHYAGRQCGAKHQSIVHRFQGCG
jgi:hypothetical protein